MIYLPLLEETGHMPDRRSTSTPREIFGHAQRIATDVRPLRRRPVLDQVTALEWDDDASRWIDPHRPRRRVPRPVRRDGHRPAAPPQASRASPASRRSRATRSTPAAGTTTYTGGDPPARRSTGSPTSGSASSAPAPPPCSASRTWPARPASCSCSSARRRRSTCATTTRSTRSGSPRSSPAGSSEWLTNFATLQTGGFADEDLVQDGWTDISQRIRDRVVAMLSEPGASSGPS